MKDNIIYGRNPIVEALQLGKGIDKILMQKGIEANFAKEIRYLAKMQNIPVQEVPFEKLNRETIKNHQGIIAFTSMVKYYSVDDILSEVLEKGEIPLFIICDGITDVGNLGAIARTAFCTGVHAIIVPSQGTAPINADTVKTSAGAIQKIPICKVNHIKDAIFILQQSGVSIAATDIRASNYIQNTQLNIPLAIVVGDEGRGIQPSILKMADIKIRIPMVQNFDSYNVSVATGIVLYETLRQRLN